MSSSHDDYVTATRFELQADGLPTADPYAAVLLGVFSEFGAAYRALLAHEQVEGLRINIFRGDVCAGFILRTEVRGV